MTYSEIREAYRAEVVTWLINCNKQVSEHVIDIIVSILLNRDKVELYGGSFVQAILTNNLKGAINYADDDIQANLITVYKAYHNIDTYHINKHQPAVSAVL